MGFIDFFRPKWKHGDVDVRAAAVGDLDDLELLGKIAREDSDARVRKIALKRIDDPELLSRMAVDDPDEGLRKAAAEKATELLVAAAVSTDEAAAMGALGKLSNVRGMAEVAKRAAVRAVRQKAVAGLADPKALVDVAKHAEDQGIRKDAVARIASAELLRDLALHEVEKAVGLAAVEKIDEAEALETVSKRAKNKAVRAAAAERLQAMRKPAEEKKVEEVSPEKRRRARKVQLCTMVEAASKSFEWEKAADEIAAARVSWGELGDEKGEEELTARFEKACQVFRKRRDEAKKHVEEALPKADPREMERAKARVEAEQHAVEERVEKEKERAERDVERAKARAEREIEDAKHAAERERIAAEKAAMREQREAERGSNGEVFSKLCDAMEAAVPTDQLKVVEKALKRAQEAEIGPLPRETEAALKGRFEAARQKLVIRVQELRETEDWKRWTHVPKLEALIVRVEKLLEEADLKQAAKELKAAQAEWKEVGPAPRDKSEALWNKFKTASDQVYARVHVMHQQQDEERAGNLKRKEELCARVEELAATPEITDWKEMAERVKLLQEEWKAVGPVPKESGDAIWKRFREACDKFFERRKEQFAKLDEERNANLAKLEALCERVERLAGMAEIADWKGAAEQVKGAQADWKEIGPPPREKSEAVWLRFRAACDKFFERRKEQFAKLDEERAANLAKKEELIKRAEEAADAGGEDPIGAVKALMAEWKTVGPAPREKADEVWERFREACDRLRTGRGPEPEPVVAEAAKEGRPGIESKFENKLPLADFLEQLVQKDEETKGDTVEAGEKAETVETASEPVNREPGTGNREPGGAE